MKLIDMRRASRNSFFKRNPCSMTPPSVAACIYVSLSLSLFLSLLYLSAYVILIPGLSGRRTQNTRVEQLSCPPTTTIIKKGRRFLRGRHVNRWQHNCCEFPPPFVLIGAIKQYSHTPEVIIMTQIYTDIQKDRDNLLIEYLHPWGEDICVCTCNIYVHTYTYFFLVRR